MYVTNRCTDELSLKLSVEVLTHKRKNDGITLRCFTDHLYRVLRKNCIIFKNFQNWAAIDRSEKFQPTRVTVHSQCVENFEVTGVIELRTLLSSSLIFLGEEWVAVDWEKMQFFLNILYIDWVDASCSRRMLGE